MNNYIKILTLFLGTAAVIAATVPLLSTVSSKTDLPLSDGVTVYVRHSISNKICEKESLNITDKFFCIKNQNDSIERWDNVRLSEAEFSIFKNKNKIIFGTIIPKIASIEAAINNKIEMACENNIIFDQYNNKCRNDLWNDSIYSYNKINNLTYILRRPVVKSNKYIIYLPGGPYAETYKYIDYEEAAKYLLFNKNIINYNVVMPIYLGINKEYYSIDGDIEIAKNQIQYLVDQLPVGHKICMIGGSLGGYIAAQERIGNGKMLLINPISDRPALIRDELVANLKPYFITLSQTNAGVVQKRSTQLSAGEAYIRYFGQYKNATLPQLIEKNASDSAMRPNIKIIYAHHDMKSGIENRNILNILNKMIGNNNIIDINPEAKHEYGDTKNWIYYKEEIQKFVKDC